MPKKNLPATSQPRSKQRPRRTELQEQRHKSETRILSVPDDMYVKALQDLLKNARPPISSYRAQISLLQVYYGLFTDDYRSGAELERLRRKTDDPTAVRKGLDLYAMMDQLSDIYSAKGDRVGPSCYVQPLCAADYRRLTPEQIKIEAQARPYFGGKKKPTLQSLAGAVLGFSLSSVKRYVRAVLEYPFKHEDPHRQVRIERVNAFCVRVEIVTLDQAGRFATGKGVELGPWQAEQLAAIRRQAESVYASVALSAQFRHSLLDTIQSLAASVVPLAGLREYMDDTALMMARSFPTRDLIENMPGVDHMLASIAQSVIDAQKHAARSALSSLLGPPSDDDPAE